MKTLPKASDFNRLSNKRKRVLIAQDVLARLSENKIKPRRNVMLEPDNLLIEDDESASEAIKAAKSCTVCAKGAVICSLVNRYNNAKGSDLDEMYDGSYTGLDQLDTKKIFGEDLWNELECQFEGAVYYRSFETKEVLGSNEVKPKSLKWLMENLIENNGQLKINGKLIG